MSVPIIDAAIAARIQRVLDEAAAKAPQQWTRVALATTGKAGPAVRYVLLKEFSEAGFVFYTNYESAKANQLGSGTAALAFHWWETGCQLRASGAVEKTSAEASDAYFATRDRQSQLGAWASAQSQPAGSPLSERVQAVAERFPDEVPRPSHWGGYLLRPDRLELWFDRPARLHDRFEFSWDGQRWHERRLDP